jgi:hypothetical protein
MAKKEIEPTPEDYETVRRQIENPRESMLAMLARIEARRRVEAERRERRAARWRRMRRLLRLRRAA